MTATTLDEPTRVIEMPKRQAADRGPVPVGQVLAEVLPLAAFRRSTRPLPLPTDMSRRSAALAEIGAWRRVHPDVPFEQDFAAAERINLEFGVR